MLRNLSEVGSLKLRAIYVDMNNAKQPSFFKKKRSLFKYIDELDELDRITHA